MTTVLVVAKPDRIAIGADTMTKFGRSYESADLVVNPSKIVKVGDSYLAYTGHASLALVLSRYFDGLEEAPQLDSTGAIFDASRALHAGLKEDFFLNPEADEHDTFEGFHFHSLIANPAGIFGLYSHRSVLEYSRYYSFGSGSEYALGALATLYDRTDDPAEIAREALEVAAMFDDGTGAPFEIHSFARSRPAAQQAPEPDKTFGGVGATSAASSRLRREGRLRYLGDDLDLLYRSRAGDPRRLWATPLCGRTLS